MLEKSIIEKFFFKNKKIEPDKIIETLEELREEFKKILENNIKK